jgi:hypothetical protein
LNLAIGYFGALSSLLVVSLPISSIHRPSRRFTAHLVDSPTLTPSVEGGESEKHEIQRLKLNVH